MNLTDSLNVTESNLSVNLSRVLHTIQVRGVSGENNYMKEGKELDLY